MTWRELGCITVGQLTKCSASVVGVLAGWEQGDDAWDEHAKHYPNCFFILGHDAGNVPLTTPRPRLNGRIASVETFEGRLDSFNGRQHPIDPERLARAGFYSTGNLLLCFSM